jgi:hypothetical protein
MIIRMETFSVGTILCAVMLHVVLGSPHSDTPPDRLKPARVRGHGDYMAGKW